MATALQKHKLWSHRLFFFFFWRVLWWIFEVKIRREHGQTAKKAQKSRVTKTRLVWHHWHRVPRMGPVRIRHSSHATQSSHSVDRAGWQSKMASIGIWIPWRNAHKPHFEAVEWSWSWSATKWLRLIINFSKWLCDLAWSRGDTNCATTGMCRFFSHRFDRLLFEFRSRIFAIKLYRKNLSDQRLWFLSAVALEGHNRILMFQVLQLRPTVVRQLTSIFSSSWCNASPSPLPDVSRLQLLAHMMARDRYSRRLWRSSSVLTK